MTILTIKQIYGYWIGAGGPTGDIAVYFTAIALAESGGDTNAHSPSDDYGVWQINGVHAGEFPRLWPLRYEPAASAKMAVAISGGGTNVGPWCTAWLDPRNCGHYHAPPPDAGSPAGSHVAHVAAVVGAADVPPLGGTASVTGPVRHPGQDHWSRLQDIVGPTGLRWHVGNQVDRSVIRRI